MWSDRISFEALTSPRPSSFVTLTYSEDNLHSRSVCLDDLQKFHKRFRDNLYRARLNQVCISIPGVKIKKSDIQLPQEAKYRFFQASEYGETTFRPHYHLCITNVNSFDKTDYECLYNAWSYDHGDSQIGIITADSLLPARIRYCVKYISAENPVQAKQYKALGLAPLFHTMSKGIGAKWIEEHADMIRETNGYFSNGVLRPLPRYYKEKLGMIEVNSYIKDLTGIWSQYNNKLVKNGLEPIDPFHPSQVIERGLLDQVSPDNKRTVLTMIIGNREHAESLVKKELLKNAKKSYKSA